MAGRHVRLEEQRVPVGLQGPELRDVLRGLPVHDLAVVEGGLDEHRGVALPREVRVGTVSLEVVVLVLLLRVPPLFELAHREGQRLVEHGVDDVHERDLGDHGLEEIGTQVGDRAHEKAPRAPALDDEPVGRGPFLRHHVLRGGDEVGEGVQLLHHPPLVVPGLAHLASSAHMGEGDREPAVQQAHAVGGEADRQGEPVGPIAVEVNGRLSVPPEIPSIDDRQRDPDPVLRGRVDPLRRVPRRVVTAQHLGLLEQGGGPLLHVVVEHRAGRHQRLVVVAEGGGVELRLGEGHPVRRARAQVGHPQLRQPPLPLEEHVVALEEVDAFEHHLGAVGDDLLPVRPTRAADGRPGQAKVAAGVVDADVERLAVVIDVVLLIMDPRGNELPLAPRGVGGQE